MDFVKIQSSNLAGAYYDGVDLFLQFNSGAEYRYQEVAEGIYEELLAAESAGKYFHANIRGRYVEEKVK